MPQPITLGEFARLCIPGVSFLPAEAFGPATVGVHSHIDRKKAKLGEATDRAKHVLARFTAPSIEGVTAHCPLVRMHFPFPYPTDEFPSQPVLNKGPLGRVTDETAQVVSESLSARWLSHTIPGRRPTDRPLPPHAWVQSLPSGTPGTYIYARPEMLCRYTRLTANYPAKREEFGSWLVTAPLPPQSNLPWSETLELFALDRNRQIACDRTSSERLARYVEEAYTQFRVALHITRLYLEFAGNWANASNNNDAAGVAKWGPPAESWQLLSLADEHSPPTVCSFFNTDPNAMCDVYVAVGPHTVQQILKLADHATTAKRPLVMY